MACHRSLLAQVRSLLRELPFGMPVPPPALERSLLVINRNVCQRMQEGQCHTGREVPRQAGILAALKEAFADREIIDAKGGGPLVEQAAQFRRAAVVAGPYGAGLNNMYFCPDHTSIVEFVAAKRKNIFVFGAYAHIHGFPYWVVVSPGTDYSGITPRAVVETIEQALHVPSVGTAYRGVVEYNSDFLRDGYGQFTAFNATSGPSGACNDKCSASTRVGW